MLLKNNNKWGKNNYIDKKIYKYNKNTIDI